MCLSISLSSRGNELHLLQSHFQLTEFCLLNFLFSNIIFVCVISNCWSVDVMVMAVFCALMRVCSCVISHSSFLCRVDLNQNLVLFLESFISTTHFPNESASLPWTTLLETGPLRSLLNNYPFDDDRTDSAIVILCI